MRSKSVLVERNKKGEKREQSNDIENSENEPARKIRKLNNSSHVDYVDFVNLTEIRYSQIYLTKFAIPSLIYRYISERNNKIFLFRSADSVKCSKKRIKTIDQVADYLSTLRFHEQSNKNKSKLVKSPNKSPKLQFSMNKFYDCKGFKNWKTVEAKYFVDAIYYICDRRKSRRSFQIERLISDYFIPTEVENEKVQTSIFELDVSKVLKKCNNPRVSKVILNIKILAKEKKVLLKNAPEKSQTLYPVTYDTFLPFYSLNSNESQTMLESGNYELYLKISNLEECDDSALDTSTLVSDFEEVFASKWSKESNECDEEQSQRIQFNVKTINNNTQIKKKFNTRSNSTILPPLITVSPAKTTSGEPLAPISLNIENNMSAPLIMYAFCDGSSIVQWSKMNTFDCPWCFQKSKEHSDYNKAAKQLVNHLNRMHPKFTSTLSGPTLKEGIVHATIRVKLSIEQHSFGGLGIGFQYEKKRSAIQNPIRRMPITELIFCRSQKKVKNEQIKSETKSRQYYHSWTAEKMTEIEINQDSEGEENYEWLKEYYHRRTEEFLDINQSEKRVMELWNEAILKYGLYISENQMGHFVTYFIDSIISQPSLLIELKSLRNTMTLHLINLVDFGILPVENMLECVQKIDSAIDQI